MTVPCVTSSFTVHYTLVSPDQLSICIADGDSTVRVKSSAKNITEPLVSHKKERGCRVDMSGATKSLKAFIIIRIFVLLQIQQSRNVSTSSMEQEDMLSSVQRYHSDS